MCQACEPSCVLFPFGLSTSGSQQIALIAYCPPLSDVERRQTVQLCASSSLSSSPEGPSLGPVELWWHHSFSSECAAVWPFRWHVKTPPPVQSIGSAFSDGARKRTVHWSRGRVRWLSSFEGNRNIDYVRTVPTERNPKLGVRRT